MEGSGSLPAFIIFFFNCTGTISHPPANSPLPSPVVANEQRSLSPATLSPRKWNQRAFSVESFSNSLHGLRNRNPVQAQPNPFLHCFYDSPTWNHSLQGVGKGFCLFDFPARKIKTAKQAKIRTASITDNAGVQQLDCSSHSCSALPDKFLPDPVGQWWKTLSSGVFFKKYVFFKAWFSCSQCQLKSVLLSMLAAVPVAQYHCTWELFRSWLLSNYARYKIMPSCILNSHCQNCTFQQAGL